jgi:hypothetical protein
MEHISHWLTLGGCITAMSVCLKDAITELRWDAFLLVIT